MGFISDFLSNFATNKWTTTSFAVELEDKYALPAAEDFVYPNGEVICEALEKYACSSRKSVDIICRTAPVTFWLNRKEKYQVEVRRDWNTGVLVLYCVKVNE